MQTSKAVVLITAAAWMELGCSAPAPRAVEKKPPENLLPARITQFYATIPKMQPGDKELLCYGVENAAAVWLSPLRQQLTASLSLCVEVAPPATTIYRLSAEGADGKTVVQDLRSEERRV